MGRRPRIQMGRRTTLNAGPRRLFVALPRSPRNGRSSHRRPRRRPKTSSPPATRTTRQVDSGWQAGTCKEEPPESAQLCSVATPISSSKRPPAIPKWGFTQFIVKHTTVGPLETPVGEVETVRVDLPVGLSINPGATERCPLATFQAGASGCPSGISGKVGEGSIVGESLVTTSARRRRHPADQTTHPGPGLQRHPTPRRVGEVRPRTRRPGSVPARRRRLGRRLPRGIHDRRSQNPPDWGARPEKPPRLRRQLRRRHLHHDPQHLPRRSVHRIRDHLLDPAPRPVLERRKKKKPSRLRLPAERRARLRISDSAGHLAERMRHDPL